MVKEWPKDEDGMYFIESGKEDEFWEWWAEHLERREREEAEKFTKEACYG